MTNSAAPESAPAVAVASAADTRVAVSVILPAHNEAALIEPVVDDIVGSLRTWGRSFEIRVMENGSTDATADIAESLSKAYPEVRAESSTAADYGKAIRGGLLRCRGAIAVLFDVDYYDVSFLLEAVALLEGSDDDQVAIVLGSKRAPGAHDERPWRRRAITAGFNFVLHRAFGLAVTDTHGIKALDRKRLLPIVAECQLDADLFDTELVIRAGRAGLRVAELPVTVREQRPPRSSILGRGMRTVGGLRKLRRALREPPSPVKP